MFQKIKYSFEECRQLGLGDSLFRAWWELRLRSGLLEKLAPPAPLPPDPAQAPAQLNSWLRGAKLPPLDDPSLIAESVRDRIPQERLIELGCLAGDAARGRIHAFGNWTADYGCPIDWHVNPVNRRRWNQALHWTRATADSFVGDIKLTWEIARFPHAYVLARTAAFFPDRAPELMSALEQQISSFVESNPFGMGVHWASGQEIAIRLLSWAFSLRVLSRFAPIGNEVSFAFLKHVTEGAHHIDRYFEYVEHAVNNNHLISEAFGLYLCGLIMPQDEKLRQRGERAAITLVEQFGRQIYPDGVHFQNSPNYHRSVLQLGLFTLALLPADAENRPVLVRALERSLDFLFAQQNPEDGRLPNFGFNDGSLPAILSTCDFSDFRPLLQTVSLATRGERLYDPGPWDEEAAWLLGVSALNTPLRKPHRTSAAFRDTGYYVLRGNDAGSYSTFRCGTLAERFSQIDMLHVDIWWRGRNVLVDGGTYSYNGEEHWHEHFHRTESHNTVQIDALDQMLHYRRFKCLYLTAARLIRFIDTKEWALCEGEHFGYQRHHGSCVHRRSVLFVKDSLWIVVDTLTGVGAHSKRVHWLGGEFPYVFDTPNHRLVLQTPDGPFSISAFSDSGQHLDANVVCGQEEPPRGWLSRYYASKIPVPSFEVVREGDLPLTTTSILCHGVPVVQVQDSAWTVSTPETAVSFELVQGAITSVLPVDSRLLV